jgi:glucosamine kinase
MTETATPLRHPEGTRDSGLRTLYAGVDGGASKTVAVVVDAEGRERGRGSAPSSNQTAVGMERAIGAVRSAIEAATAELGGPAVLAIAWVGLAGVDRPADQEVWLPHLRPLAGEIRLTNDAELVLGALPGGVGVAAIAGTGSIMFGRDAQGRRTRAGGWGHVFGDEGSGYDLGRGALMAAARAADGRGPTTALLPALLRHWDLPEASGLIGRVYPNADKATIASLASLVFEAARQGDATAEGLVAAAAAELALGIVTVADALDLPIDALPLALTGGLLVGVPELRAATLDRVRQSRPLGPVVVVEDPAVAAARAVARMGR